MSDEFISQPSSKRCLPTEGLSLSLSVGKMIFPRWEQLEKMRDIVVEADDGRLSGVAPGGGISGKTPETLLLRRIAVRGTGVKQSRYVGTRERRRLQASADGCNQPHLRNLACVEIS